LRLDILLVLIGIGAAANALWFDFRFPALAPRELKFGLVHLLAASLLAHTAVPLALDLPGDSQVAALVGVFGVAFPVLAYIFVSGFWMLRIAHGMLGGLHR
jgi:hypothetical protein